MEAVYTLIKQSQIPHSFKAGHDDIYIASGQAVGHILIYRRYSLGEPVSRKISIHPSIIKSLTSEE